jgi:hypothetical protein
VCVLGLHLFYTPLSVPRNSTDCNSGASLDLYKVRRCRIQYWWWIEPSIGFVHTCHTDPTLDLRAFQFEILQQYRGEGFTCTWPVYYYYLLLGFSCCISITCNRIVARANDHLYERIHNQKLQGSTRWLTTPSSTPRIRNNNHTSTAPFRAATSPPIHTHSLRTRRANGRSSRNHPHHRPLSPTRTIGPRTFWRSSMHGFYAHLMPAIVTGISTRMGTRQMAEHHHGTRVSIT